MVLLLKTVAVDKTWHVLQHGLLHVQFPESGGGAGIASSEPEDPEVS